MYLQVVHYYDRKAQTPGGYNTCTGSEAITKNCEGEACKKKRVKKFKLFNP